mgnify:CR=1 FL=1
MVETSQELAVRTAGGLLGVATGPFRAGRGTGAQQAVGEQHGAERRAGGEQHDRQPDRQHQCAPLPRQPPAERGGRGDEHGHQPQDEAPATAADVLLAGVPAGAQRIGAHARDRPMKR